MTFEELIETKPRELDRLMKQGARPQFDEIVGYEFRGHKNYAFRKRAQERKFIRGFFGQPQKDHLWGYNVPTVQNALGEKWIPEIDGSQPVRHLFFKVIPSERYRDPKCDPSLVLDYAASGEYEFWDYAKNMVDYMVYPDPVNKDLILGKRYEKVSFIFISVMMFTGYFVLERFQAADYPRESHYFVSHELRTLEKFAEAFYHNCDTVISPQQVAFNVDKQVEQMTSNRRDSFKLILNVVEHVLPLLTGNPSFSKMDVARRKQFLREVFQNTADNVIGDVLRDLSRFKVLITMGYYADKKVHENVGFTPVADRLRLQPDDLKPLGVPRVTVHEPNSTEIQADICVIGSGAGGAVMAFNAAQDGKKVVLIEEGPYVPADQVTHDEGAMSAKLYKEGGLQTTVDFDMTILQGKCLGGTTVINNLICFRLEDADLNENAESGLLKSWRDLGAPIDQAALGQSFDRVEKVIGVRRIEQDIALGNASVLLKGIEQLRQIDSSTGKYRSQLFRKNLKDCLGCGYCNFACPYERKLSMLETYIPEAVKHGARVIVNCHAEKIEAEAGRVKGVRCRVNGNQDLFVQANKVVVACGAIGSSKLLMKSGLGRNVGRRFSFNAATPVFARFPHTVDGFDGVQMGAFIDCDDYMLESLFNPPMSFGMTLPGWFEDHFMRMKQYRNLACAGVLVGTDNESSVKGWSLIPDLVGPVELRLTHSDMMKLKRGMTMLSRVFFAAGAEEVYLTTFKDTVIPRSIYENDRNNEKRAIWSIIDKLVTVTDDLVLNSSHPQGGNVINDDPDQGTVNSKFEVHGCRNLYVCDASVFPTTIRINPQLTIMAMADYAWHTSIGKE